MRRTLPVLTLLALTGLGVSACGDPGATSAAVDKQHPARLVLADGESDVNYHPATGYGQAGVSPVYDGLLRLAPTQPGRIPDFKPALAQDLPQANADASQWTVKLKEGIKFSDGTDFDANDVKASYDVAKDPETGSEVAAVYNVIKDVQAPDSHTVVFTLQYPLSQFNSYLTYAIAPSERVAQGKVTENELNQQPVGTGAYELVEKRGDETIFKANESYWDGAAPVKELVITTAADDTSRAQRVAAQEFDGAVIPSALAKSVAGNKNVRVDAAKGADWRAVSLPGTPELQDPKVRQALNLAVDRQAVVDGPLAGYGTPLGTLISDIYGDAHDPSAVFNLDTAKAERLLDEAGWAKGTNGIRHKDGKPFHVVLYYHGSDTGRRDVAIEFAGQMKKLGIEFEPKAGTWDEITPKMNEAAVLLGGGDTPYDVDMMAYSNMHTRTEATSEYANPGNYGSPELDDVLQQARTEIDTTKRNELWRKAQQLWLENPSVLMLAHVDHVYVSQVNEWHKPDLLLEPHIHGATWGPWWRVAEWTS
ncbi:ABC transporter substrate-binding protein [Corynebacterium sp. H128]|uniref:ABC transporter substrate-binding protein n=1 Tax=Corynebacterium sp. H128 TaxID=3133427 RepID=UPI0030B2C351